MSVSATECGCQPEKESGMVLYRIAGVPYRTVDFRVLVNNGMALARTMCTTGVVSAFSSVGRTSCTVPCPCSVAVRSRVALGTATARLQPH
jgi:hypothetical protein